MLWQAVSSNYYWKILSLHNGSCSTFFKIEGIFGICQVQKTKSAKKQVQLIIWYFLQGLASHEYHEAVEYFKYFEKHVISLVSEAESEAEDALNLAFCPKQIDKRRNWILENAGVWISNFEEWISNFELWICFICWWQFFNSG